MIETDRSLINRLERQHQILNARILRAQHTSETIINPEWKTPTNRYNPNGRIPEAYNLETGNPMIDAQHAESREWISLILSEEVLPRITSELQLVDQYTERLRNHFSLLDETHTLMTLGVIKNPNYIARIQTEIRQDTEEINEAKEFGLIHVPKAPMEETKDISEVSFLADRRGIQIPSPKLISRLLHLSPKELGVYEYIYTAKSNKSLLNTTELANLMYPGTDLQTAKSRVGSILYELRNHAAYFYLDIPSITGERESRYDLSYAHDFTPVKKPEDYLSVPTAKEVSKSIRLSENEYMVYGLIRFNRNNKNLASPQNLAETIFQSQTDDAIQKVKNIVKDLRIKLDVLDLSIKFTRLQDSENKGYDFISRRKQREKRELLGKKSTQALSYFVDEVPIPSLEILRNEIDVEDQLVHPIHVRQCLESAIKKLSKRVLSGGEFSEEDYKLWISLRKSIGFKPGSQVQAIILTRIKEWYESQRFETTQIIIPGY